MTVEIFQSDHPRGYLRSFYSVSSCSDILNIWFDLQKIFFVYGPTLKKHASNIVDMVYIKVETKNNNHNEKNDPKDEECVV